ncbi:MAG: HD domain-containing protein [Enhygromyxa sp.]
MVSLVEQLLAPAITAGREGSLPDPAALEAISRTLGDDPAILRGCPPAQLYPLLTEAICGRRPDLAMQVLHDTGVLAQVLPELEATVDFSQEAGRRHKDVWEHTKTVVWQAVPKPTVRWAAMLHDIGKVPTRRFIEGGGVTFHGHAEVGERMFLRGPARRIGFPPAEREAIAALIRFHLRPGQYEQSWTDSAVRRFAREVGPQLDDLLNLSRADITSKRPGRRKRCLQRISELSRRIRALQAEDQKPKPLPSGLGKVLMSALGLPPGKQIGQLRASLEALFEAGEIEGGREPEYYVEQVRARGLMERRAD